MKLPIIILILNIHPLVTILIHWHTKILHCLYEN